MKPLLPSTRRGFTLVEIMIVVALFAMIAAIATPNFLRSRRRAQATCVLNDLRILDYALDRWAIEHNKAAGAIAVFDDLKPYPKGWPAHADG